MFRGFGMHAQGGGRCTLVATHAMDSAVVLDGFMHANGDAVSHVGLPAQWAMAYGMAEHGKWGSCNAVRKAKKCNQLICINCSDLYRMLRCKNMTFYRKFRFEQQKNGTKFPYGKFILVAFSLL